jgi:hypothetical protein
MPVIEVKKPFGLRISSKAERRDFGVGRHTVSEEELAHWFMQACLSPEDGRAELVTDADEEGAGSGELAAPAREDLLKLKNSELEELLVACGVTPVPNTKKADLADMILAGHEGVTIVMGPDGIYVQTGDSVPQAPPGSSQAKPDDAPVQKAE